MVDLRNRERFGPIWRREFIVHSGDVRLKWELSQELLFGFIFLRAVSFRRIVHTDSICRNLERFPARGSISCARTFVCLSLSFYFFLHPVSVLFFSVAAANAAFLGEKN